MSKKVVVVGGSNGIGLAISKQLIDRGYHINIVDIKSPEHSYLIDGKYDYFHSDLRDFDADIFESFAKDNDVEALVITAGFGRVAHFEDLHVSEIDNLIKVNTLSCINIIKLFYDRICSEKRFYCAVMGSIAGLLSSPLFSVYAASKAAVCRFVESVNIELEMKHTENRITNVSPASIAGTKFNGGDNNISKITGLAEDIISSMFSAQQLYIPQFEQTYKGVIERYINDPHEYGLHSYEYKMNAGRVTSGRQIKIGYLSGTFDLFHVGHLNLLRKAKQQCDYLIVGVHKDGSWKGKETYISFEERKEIVGACRYVDKVVDSCSEDSMAWDIYHYDRLFVGSDYKGTERFKMYEEYFRDKNVEIIYFPYTQGTSSTQIRNAIGSNNNTKE